MGTALIKWDKVALPKEQGGLGVLNLQLQNKALLMKHLHKFFNVQDLSWVKLVHERYYANRLVDDRPVGSFWWRSILKLLPEYKDMAICYINNGNTAMFWNDSWNLTGKISRTALLLQFWQPICQ